MIFDLIKDHAKIFPTEKVCKVLKISQSGYYRWKTTAISQRLQKKNVLKEKITAFYFESKQRYGSPRITMKLNILGYKISRPESFARTCEAITVAKYMRELGLKSKLSKKIKITTDSKHNYILVKNVLNRQFMVPQPSKAWVSDITYIHTKEGFLYQ